MLHGTQNGLTPAALLPSQMYVILQKNMRLCTCAYTSVHTCVNIRVCVCVSVVCVVYMGVCEYQAALQIYTYICICVHIYIYVYIHIIYRICMYMKCIFLCGSKSHPASHLASTKMHTHTRTNNNHIQSHTITYNHNILSPHSGLGHDHDVTGRVNS